MSEFDLRAAVKPVGQALLEFSQFTPTSARGLVGALFPYILAASRRMSTRAISGYLEETHKVKISAATIAKALREPEKHLETLIDLVEPAARVVSDAHDIELVELLSRKELFKAASGAPPALWGNTDVETGDAYREYTKAHCVLRDVWFSTDGVVRSMALAQIGRSEKEGKADADAE
jgi:hypothetical protein